jgi:HlyD family secretion protein
MGALFRNKNKWAVFRVSGENIIELRYVEIGHSNNLEAEIVSGLEDSDRVVLYPSDTLQSGMPISVATE